MTTFNVRPGGLDHPAVLRLLQEHLDEMHATSPPESVHALDVGRLAGPGVTFWAAWDGDVVLGCGALATLDARHGEVKSMRTAAAARGRGVATAVLDVVVAEARRRGMTRLSLETGTQAHFAPARRLYARHGFVGCGPFAGYGLDPHSAFFTLVLRRPPGAQPGGDE